MPTQSTSFSEKERKQLHASVVHSEICHSPLSKESHEQNYRGFLHLAILLLVVGNLRLVFENFQKYGWRLSIPGKYLSAIEVTFFMLNMATLLACLGLSFLLEIALSKHKQQSLFTFLIILNAAASFFIPSFLVWNWVFHPPVGAFILLIAVAISMKIISYHLVNSELRSGLVNNKLYEKCPYPRNLTLKNLTYFSVAPTLCYQPVYPRNQSFRWTFFLKRVIEFLSATSMIYFMLEQYAIPTVENSLRSMNDLHMTAIVERLLKLSVSSLYIWLLFFYAIFHSFLNALAEALRFGDRSFYKPWWNANSIEEYWRLWNLPVHNWLKRHVYFQLRLLKFSTSNAQFTIFLLSAVFHEVIIAVPTKIIQFWVFTGMLLQFPLILITNLYRKHRPNSSFGNYFFWISFCIVGQPACVLLYYRAWKNKFDAVGA